MYINYDILYNYVDKHFSQSMDDRCKVNVEMVKEDYIKLIKNVKVKFNRLILK
jgi:hypothetical protein